MGVLGSLLYPGYKGWDRGSCGSFADWMRHVYWVAGRVSQRPPPCGVGGETGYTVPLIVTTWGRER